MVNNTVENQKLLFPYLKYGEKYKNVNSKMFIYNTVENQNLRKHSKFRTRNKMNPKSTLLKYGEIQY